jgi:hypothetical protein
MCLCCIPWSCPGCGHALKRRDFLKGCGLAAAAFAGASSQPSLAQEPKNHRARVGLVFLSKEGASWPHPKYETAGRQQEVLSALRKGCPNIDFVPTVVAEPADVQKAIALKDQVDGYLIYVVTLMWRLQPAITQIGRLGKPVLLADETLGGSGVFLCGYGDLLRQKIPAAAVASTRLADLVAVARQFDQARKPGVTPASFAQRCRGVYRSTFPATGEMKCLDDPVPLSGIGECLKRFKQSRFLIVTQARSGREQDFLGAKGIYVGFDEFKTYCGRTDRDEAAEWAQRWTKQAEKVVEPSPGPIEKAGAVYLATRQLLKKHGTDSVTMNCLGGFAMGLLPAYPCLGFMQILDDGGQGVCQAMPDDSLSMLMARILTGRPGYVSNPVLDTSRNRVIYSHCVATTRPFGPQGSTNPFRIRTLHDRDPRSVCNESLLPAGYMTTSFRVSCAEKKMIVHQAKAIGNLEADRGCRTQLVAEVRGDIGRLFDRWGGTFDWHRVTVYGDVKEPLVEFAKALGLAIIEEA